jgi:hypothetical protein
MSQSDLATAWPVVGDRLDAAVWSALYGGPGDCSIVAATSDSSDSHDSAIHDSAIHDSAIHDSVAPDSAIPAASNAGRSAELSETGQIDCLVLLERMQGTP